MKISGGKFLPPDIFFGAGGNIVFLGAIFVRMGGRDGRMVLKSSPMQNFFAAATLHNRDESMFLIFF